MRYERRELTPLPAVVRLTVRELQICVGRGIDF